MEEYKYSKPKTCLRYDVYKGDQAISVQLFSFEKENKKFDKEYIKFLKWYNKTLVYKKY
mgnify:CR=1 FL=1